MRKLPPTMTTKEGSVLCVAINPYSSNKKLSIIEFRHEGGGLCSQYFLPTFMAIPDKKGLCLHSHRWNNQSINADQVTICKMLIKSYELSND